MFVFIVDKIVFLLDIDNYLCYHRNTVLLELIPQVFDHLILIFYNRGHFN